MTYDADHLLNEYIVHLKQVYCLSTKIKNKCLKRIKSTYHKAEMDISKFKIKIFIQKSEKMSHKLGKDVCQHAVRKGFILRIYKELFKINEEKTTRNRKLGKGYELEIHGRRNQMTKII